MRKEQPAINVQHTIDLAYRVLKIEANAITALSERIDDSFARAVDLILKSGGRVILSGIGKSGHIACKIAATLASTGTPAYFVHAAEAVHGDLGMITHDDVLIAISNSGCNDELLTVVPLVKRQGGKLIAITGNLASPLAREADVHLDASVAEEACPLNLAPTASTTVALALGDALAVALLDARSFSATDFAKSHPGGSLGRKLLTHVRDVMRSGSKIPVVEQSATLVASLLKMTDAGMGMVLIVDDRRHVVGIFTDGDLRRTIERGCDLRVVKVAAVMTTKPRSITPERLAVEAVEMMERFKTYVLPVVDASGTLVGALNMHDLFNAKVI